MSDLPAPAVTMILERLSQFRDEMRQSYFKIRAKLKEIETHLRIIGHRFDRLLKETKRYER